MAMEIDEAVIRVDNHAEIDEVEPIEISDDEARRVRLYENFYQVNAIDPALYAQHDVKRGLRNADGTGVLAGMTNISNVHGYVMSDGEKMPAEGSLRLRGYDLYDLLGDLDPTRRFAFEEVAYLLLMGYLPSRGELDRFNEIMNRARKLPNGFTEDMIMKNPSRNIMNKLARSVLALYSYDDNPDDQSLENNMRQSLSLIARMPSIMSYAYQVKRRHFDKQSMFFHPYEPNHSTAEAILNALRPDRKFTREEAKLLDLCMVLHAEHGGGNNSTFTTRVLTSAGTDIYSAIGAAVGSLKGFKHGGANHQVRMMMDDLMTHVQNWENEDEVEAYLEKILQGEAADGSGLIYGMGHAVYTLSDPRAVILKEKAQSLAKKTGYDGKLALYQLVERLAPAAFAKVTGKDKVISANVDFYSGLVYEMLGIPQDLFTPMFAVSRISGWCAHRIEELTTGGRIMRPAYRALPMSQVYVPLDQRQ